MWQWEPYGTRSRSDITADDSSDLMAHFPFMEKLLIMLSTIESFSFRTDSQHRRLSTDSAVPIICVAFPVCRHIGPPAVSEYLKTSFASGGYGYTPLHLTSVYCNLVLCTYDSRPRLTLRSLRILPQNGASVALPGHVSRLTGIYF